MKSIKYLLFTFLLLMAHGAWADIEIQTAEDWNNFCSELSGGKDFKGERVTLTGDFTVSTVAGDDSHLFRGTFDGGGHTLSLDFGDSEHYLQQPCALFYRIDKATVQNLVIEGHIYSSAQYNGSLAVKATGERTFIRNCVSRVSINSNISGVCKNGGFIGLVHRQYSSVGEFPETHVYFYGCAFNGQLIGPQACGWGGFVGWREYHHYHYETVYDYYSKADFIECLFAPTYVNINTDDEDSQDESHHKESRAFCHAEGFFVVSHRNCYFTTPLHSRDFDIVEYIFQIFPITGCDGVSSVTMYEAPRATYSVSGLKFYNTGLTFDDVLYAAKGENVRVNIDGPTPRYTANNHLLAGASNPYTLTMINDNAVITPWDGPHPNTIGSVDDWNTFCSAVNAGYDYIGETVTMTADVGNISTVAGSNNFIFRGTFDGGGHKLTMAFGSSEQYSNQSCAPFYRLDNVTIKNLVVDGSIYSSAQHNGGLAVTATGGNNYIQNCVSSVSINSSIEGDCRNGGFIGHLNTNKTYVYFNGCAFTGQLLGTNANGWGGFVGWREYTHSTYTDPDYYNYVTFTDCLFYPTTVSIAIEGNNSNAFCHSRDNTTSGSTYTNCYYTTALQTANGGKQAYSITGDGDAGITVEKAGTGTTYSTSGITSCDPGIKYNDVLYAGNGDNVRLNLSGSSTGTYICGETPLLGQNNPYILRMPNNDAVVSAWNVTPLTTIATQSDWNQFCNIIAAGYNYLGETVTLSTDDIVVSSVTGSDNCSFRGTFEGGGHTITLALGSSGSYSDQECALFYHLDNATIKSLVIEGSIYSSRPHSASLAVKASGSNTLIQNCISRVSINSNRSGEESECANGGFIGLLNTDETIVNFKGCAFTGQLLGANARNWGGFVGWRAYQSSNKSKVNFTDCFFAPTAIDIATPDGSNSRTFCRSSDNTTDGTTYTNCYYLSALQATEAGRQAYSITAGQGVTKLENAGTATLYSTSSITGYGTGIKYNGVLYAGNGEKVSLNLEGSGNGAYICGETPLTGKNPYIPRMPNNNAVIMPWGVTLPTTIASNEDWNQFCYCIAQGYTYIDETVTLTADVTDISTVAGDNSHPFQGTFDGLSHKITLAFGRPDSYSDQKCALFYRLDKATIQNLVIDGSIYSSAQNNASIAVTAVGNKNYINNCVSRVSINSDINGDCSNGGFVGLLNTNASYVYFTACAFTGEFVGENATNWGGFVGWRHYESTNYSIVQFSSCLFEPTTVQIATPDGSNSRTFCRSKDNTTNGAYFFYTYYTEALQVADGGTQPYITTTKPDNIGDEVEDYGFITFYYHGMGFDGKYYMDPEIVSLANAANNSTAISGMNNYRADVILNDRTLYKDGDWNTLCLPFDVTLEGSPLAGAEARTLSEATFNDGTLTLNFGEPVDKLNAGTPYIIKWGLPSETVLVIKSAKDWDDFADKLRGTTDFDGKTVVLAADIEVDRIVGAEEGAYRFRGTFDGRGHTLTFNKTAESWYNAPFYRVDDATIMNLHTVGTITTTDRQFCSGLVGHAMGDTTIKNCWSSVNIVSSLSGDGTHGGFVAMTHNTYTNTTLINCLFDGSITGTSTNSCGGMIGYNDCDATLTNCVFKGSTNLATGDNATFARGNNVTVEKCYYSENLPGASGQGTEIGTMTSEELVRELGSGWQLKNDEAIPVLPDGVDVVDPIFNYISFNATASTELTPTRDGSVTFKGTYDPVTFDSEDRSVLFMGGGSKLYYPDGKSSITMNAFRAYFQLNGITVGDPMNGIKEFRLNFGADDADSINEELRMKSEEFATAKGWYSLDGRKLPGKPTQRGIYIHNGRKEVLK